MGREESGEGERRVGREGGRGNGPWPREDASVEVEVLGARALRAKSTGALRVSGASNLDIFTAAARNLNR